MVTGIVPIMDITIEPRATMGHGLLLPPVLCPGRFRMYHQIFVMYRRDMNVSRTESSRKIGRHGRRKSTGTTTGTHASQKKEMVGERGIINKVKGEAKGSIKIDYQMTRKR